MLRPKNLKPGIDRLASVRAKEGRNEPSGKQKRRDDLSVAYASVTVSVETNKEVPYEFSPRKGRNEAERTRVRGHCTSGSPEGAEDHIDRSFHLPIVNGNRSRRESESFSNVSWSSRALALS